MAGVRPRQDHQVRVPPGFQGVLHIDQELVQANDVLQPTVIGGPLGKHLILDVQGGHARPLELLHRSHGVDGVAVTGIRTRDDG